MTLLSEWRGPAEAAWLEFEPTVIRVFGSTAYVVLRGDGLRAIDLADPASPAEPGARLHLQAGERFDDVAVRAGSGGEVIAFVASSGRGVVVVDATDPAELVEIGVIQVPADPVQDDEVGAGALALEGDLLYVGGVVEGGVHIFDVSDPRAPARIAEVFDPMRG